MPTIGLLETGFDIEVTQPGHRPARHRNVEFAGRPAAAATDRESEAAFGHSRRMERRLAIAASGTTPTQLPELLRNFSRQAGRLASHPVNAVDNNPFITREWLIVSQVLHTAALALENRFETLFLGR